MGDAGLGGGLESQNYTARELDAIARAARPDLVRAEAGKVYCPCCSLREARWRRHAEAATPRDIRIFVYCTQCHKTGITTLALHERGAQAGWWPRLRAWFARPRRPQRPPTGGS